jgi:hypothetical protein
MGSGSCFQFLLGVDKMSNVPNTFDLKLTILVAKFVPLFSSDWLCLSVAFIQWLTIGTFWPTLLLLLHLNGSIPLYHYTFVSFNLWFNKNYNSWSDYIVLANMQGGHSQESIMVFYMFAVKF